MTTKKSRIIKTILLPILLLAIGYLTSCSKKTEMAPDKSWVKIYDHSDFNLIFYPLDVVELSDGNFIILASKKPDSATWPTPYLLCTDNAGNIKWKLDVGTTYWSPIPNILATANGYYFFCTDENKTIYSVKINTDGSNPMVTNISTNSNSLTNPYFYPLCATQTSDNNILLTCYNYANYSTTLTCFNNNFSELWSIEQTGLENNGERILDHLTRRGTIYSFYSGELTSNQKKYYFFNGFINSLFSLIFVDPSNNGANTGGILGNGFDRSASSLIQRSDTGFILTRFTENQNFITTNPTFDATKYIESTKISGIDWPEIQTKATIKNLKTTINGKEVVVIATTTRSNKILVMLFDPLTGELKTSKYLGSTYPVNLASIIATKDGGLAVLTQTDVAESFPRIQLYKIPPEDLEY